MVQKILRTMQDDLKEAQEKKQKGGEIEDDLQQKTSAYKKEIEAFIAEDETPISDNLGAFNHSSSYSAAASTAKQKTGDEAAKAARREAEEAIKKAPVFTPAPKAQEAKPESIANRQISDLIAKMEIPLDNHEEKEEEERKRKEAEQKELEAKRIEEERVRKVQEAKKLELERIRKEEEQAEKKRKEEAQKAEEERIKKEQEEKRLEEERIRKEQEAKKLEEERIRKEQEKKKLEEERIKKEQEAKKLEEERIRKEQEEAERKRKEDEKDTEEKRMQRVEEERKRIEELKKRAEELEELKRREEDLAREEALAKQLEEERRQIEEQERKRVEELKQKEAAMRKAEEDEKQKEKEMKLREEEEIRQTEEEAKQLEEKAKQIEGDLKKKEEELKRMEDIEKKKIEELKRKEAERIAAEEVLRKKEAELKRREAMREEREDMMEAMREEIMEDKPAKKTAAVAEIPTEITPDLPEIAEEPHEEAKPEMKAPPIITEEEGYEAANGPTMPTAGKVAPAAASLEANPTVRPSAKDEELSTLVKRVSDSMSGRVATSATPTPPASKPEKDQELKDLISRMSKNLEKEKDILQKKAIAAEKVTAPATNSELKDLATRISDTVHKDKSPETPVAAPAPVAAAAPAPAPKKDVADDDKQDSYWTNLRGDMKTQEKVIRLEETPLDGETPSAIQTKITEFADKRVTDATIAEAGLIVPRAKMEAKNKLVSQNRDSSYLNPENRLVGGKQEFYSSLHKRVKTKEHEADLESLKDIVKEEEAHLSDEEEKKMLRRQIVKKYKIKLSTMPWTKIVIFTVLFLGTLGASLYLIIPRLSGTHNEEKKIELTTGESIAAIDERVSEEVTVTADKVTSLNYFDNELEPWNSYPDRSIVRLKVNYSDHDVLLPRDEALNAILGEPRAKNLPQDIKKLLDSEYNFLVFKHNGTLRMGLVLRFDENKSDEMSRAMSQWQESQTSNAKMYSVMRALFINSKLDDKQGVLFQDGAYNGTTIHYANLPDTDTSIDYFIKGDLLVITTSKTNTFEMIDLLAQ